MESENQKQNEAAGSTGAGEMNGGMNSNGAESSSSSNETSNEASPSKTFAIVGYILPVLFFLPLLDDKTKNDPFARFHANQQLVLLVLFLAIQVIHGTILIALSSLGYTIMNLLSLAMLVLVIYGALHASKGETRELPIIGKFRILK